MSELAILAGSGALPLRLSRLREDAVLIGFSGVSHDLGAAAQEHRFEAMGTLFEALHSAGVSEVVFAGSMSRPPLDPALFDPVMVGLAPRLLAAMQGGDDALLRLVIDIFEEQGFTVRGAHEIDPSLTAKPGVLAGSVLDERGVQDMLRGADILSALSPLDVGQGAVVEGGLCLGIETLQGTDALLGFVAATPQHLRRGAGGVFIKAPKRGQDLRIDMPAIGPDTIAAAADAGLRAIVIAAHQVLILEQDAVLKAAKETGIALIAQDL